jgi:hypothetical protein
MKKPILQIVRENESILRNMTSHTELREWAILQGWDSRAAFPRFKAALNEIGMDYDQIKSGVRKQTAAEVAAVVESGARLNLEQMAAFITANHTQAKAWSKDGKNRIYLSNAGYNTNKVRTTAYIYIGNPADFADPSKAVGLNVRVDCDSQPDSWCESQADLVKEQYEYLIDIVREHCALVNQSEEVA